MLCDAMDWLGRTRALRYGLETCAALALAGTSRAQCDVGSFVGSGPAGSWNFGWDVAADGDLAAVGAYKQTPFPDTGSAYVFRRDATGEWVEAALLNGEILYEQFGMSVATANGRVFVGAPHHGYQSAPGTVYVFEELGGAWTQTAKLAGSPIAYTDFGRALAAYGDRVLVGGGSAYLFERDASGAWSQIAHFTKPPTTFATAFASSVALSSSVAVVGDCWDYELAFSAGAAWVYEEAAGWTAGTKLFAPDAEAADWFGASVAVEGERIAIGAPLDGGTLDTGSVRVFERQGSNWVQTAHVVAPSPEVKDSFGWDVDLRGSVMAVGAYRDGPSESGAVFRVVSSGGSWTVTHELPLSHAKRYGALGWAVALYPRGILGGAKGASTVYDYQFAAPAPLIGCPTMLSLSAGGVQSLALDVGAQHAGKLYFVLGTTSGTSPGLPVDGLLVPLNVDGYFLFTLANPGLRPLSGALGVVSGAGQGAASFALPAGTDASLAGLRVHHAAVVVPLATLVPVQVVTNAAPLLLEP